MEASRDLQRRVVDSVTTRNTKIDEPFTAWSNYLQSQFNKIHPKLWQKYTAKSLALLQEFIEESEKYDNPPPMTTASSSEGVPQVTPQHTTSQQAMPSTSGYIPSMSMGYATQPTQHSAITGPVNQPAPHSSLQSLYPPMSFHTMNPLQGMWGQTEPSFPRTPLTQPPTPGSHINLIPMLQTSPHDTVNTPPPVTMSEERAGRPVPET